MDARAHVLAPLAVVGGGGEQGTGPRALGESTRAVEVGEAQAEAGGVASDLVERGETVVAVEGRVLGPLGHGGAGELLESEDELALARAFPSAHQDLPEEIEQRAVDVRACAASLLD